MLSQTHRDRLILENKGFAYQQARYWAARTPGVDLSDLEQASMLGMVEASRRFNPELGNKFLTYAAHWCRKECLELIRNASSAEYIPPRAWTNGYRPKRRIELDIGWDDRNSWRSKHTLRLIQDAIGFQRPTPTPEGSIVEPMLGQLPPRERLALLLWMHGARLHTIGRHLGVGRERARQIKENALESCRILLARAA